MSFFGTLFGTDAANAANQAAADTYAKQQAAYKSLQAYGDTLPARYNEISTAYAPYTSAGNSALDMYRAGLGLGGPNSADNFTSAYRALPGYQSGLDTGLQAAERGLNAGGGLNSGGALKALYRYGSNYEDQRSGDYLSRLASLANGGLQATGAQTGIQTAGIGANTGVRTTAGQMQYGASPTVGQGMVAGAQAQQDALGNLLKAATYLGGAALGGPAGAGIGSYFRGAGGPYV